MIHLPLPFRISLNVLLLSSLTVLDAAEQRTDMYQHQEIPFSAAQAEKILKHSWKEHLKVVDNCVMGLSICAYLTNHPELKESAITCAKQLQESTLHLVELFAQVRAICKAQMEPRDVVRCEEEICKNHHSENLDGYFSVERCRKAFETIIYEEQQPEKLDSARIIDDEIHPIGQRLGIDTATIAAEQREKWRQQVTAALDTMHQQTITTILSTLENLLSQLKQITPESAIWDSQKTTPTADERGTSRHSATPLTSETFIDHASKLIMTLEGQTASLHARPRLGLIRKQLDTALRVYAQEQGLTIVPPAKNHDEGTSPAHDVAASPADTSHPQPFSRMSSREKKHMINTFITNYNRIYLHCQAAICSCCTILKDPLVIRDDIHAQAQKCLTYFTNLMRLNAQEGQKFVNILQYDIDTGDEELQACASTWYLTEKSINIVYAENNLQDMISQTLAKARPRVSVEETIRQCGHTAYGSSYHMPGQDIDFVVAHVSTAWNHVLDGMESTLNKINEQLDAAGEEYGSLKRNVAYPELAMNDLRIHAITLETDTRGVLAKCAALQFFNAKEHKEAEHTYGPSMQRAMSQLLPDLYKLPPASEKLPHASRTTPNYTAAQPFLIASIHRWKEGLQSCHVLLTSPGIDPATAEMAQRCKVQLNQSLKSLEANLRPQPSEMPRTLWTEIMQELDSAALIGTLPSTSLIPSLSLQQIIAETVASFEASELPAKLKKFSDQDRLTIRSEAQQIVENISHDALPTLQGLLESINQLEIANSGNSATNRYDSANDEPLRTQIHNQLLSLRTLATPLWNGHNALLKMFVHEILAHRYEAHKAKEAENRLAQERQKAERSERELLEMDKASKKKKKKNPASANPGKPATSPPPPAYKLDAGVYAEYYGQIGPSYAAQYTRYRLYRNGDKEVHHNCDVPAGAEHLIRSDANAKNECDNARTKLLRTNQQCAEAHQRLAKAEGKRTTALVFAAAAAGALPPGHLSPAPSTKHKKKTHPASPTTAARTTDAAPALTFSKDGRELVEHMLHPASQHESFDASGWHHDPQGTATRKLKERGGIATINNERVTVELTDLSALPSTRCYALQWQLRDSPKPKRSTFFPQEWSTEQVLDAVFSAARSPLTLIEQREEGIVLYRGKSSMLSNPIEFLTQRNATNGEVVVRSAYPIVE